MSGVILLTVHQAKTYCSASVSNWACICLKDPVLKRAWKWKIKARLRIAVHHGWSFEASHNQRGTVSITGVSLLLCILVLSLALQQSHFWGSMIGTAVLTSSVMSPQFALGGEGRGTLSWRIPISRTRHDKLMGTTPSRSFISWLLVGQLTWTVARVDGLHQYPFCQCAGSPATVYLQTTKPQSIDFSVFELVGMTRSLRGTDTTGLVPPNRPSPEPANRQALVSHL